MTYFEAPDGCSYETPAEYLWVGVLGGCGCGDTRNADLALQVLRSFAAEPLDRTDDFDWQHELVAHWLDSVGLLEHGGSIAGSWLTDKGRELLAVLDDPTHMETTTP